MCNMSSINYQWILSSEHFIRISLDKELLEISIDLNAIGHDIDELGGSDSEKKTMREQGNYSPWTTKCFHSWKNVWICHCQVSVICVMQRQVIMLKFDIPMWKVSISLVRIFKLCRGNRATVVLLRGVAFRSKDCGLVIGELFCTYSLSLYPWPLCAWVDVDCSLAWWIVCQRASVPIPSFNISKYNRV